MKYVFSFFHKKGIFWKGAKKVPTTGFTRMIEHITNVHNIKDIYVTGLLLCAIDPLHMQILLRYK